MASTTITLVVQPRGTTTAAFASLDVRHLSKSIQITDSATGKPIRKLPKELQIGPNATTQEIYDALANASGFSVHRLRITKGSDRTVVPNSKATSVDDIGLKNQSVVHVKDLGT